MRDERNPDQRLADALVEVVTTGGPLDLDEDPGMTRPNDPTRDTDTDDTGDTGAEVNDEPADDAGDADGDPDLDAIDAADGLAHSRHGLGDGSLCGGDADPVLDFGLRLRLGRRVRRRSPLNLWTRSPTALDPLRAALVALFDSHAAMTAWVAPAGLDPGERRLARGLHRALDLHTIINQAVGYLVERHQVRPDDAFELLRATTRSNGTDIARTAGRVLIS